MARTASSRPLPPFAKPSANRSRNMAAIKSKDTKPELAVRGSLHNAGFRFRLRTAGLPGRVDIVLPRYRQVVLVHGCFWHGHTCRVAHTPKTNTEYWSAKIQGNVERDARNRKALELEGWKVTTIWECCLADGIESLVRDLDNKRSNGL